MLPFSLFQFVFHFGSFFCAFWEASGCILAPFWILWGFFGVLVPSFGCPWLAWAVFGISLALGHFERPRTKKTRWRGNARSALR